MLFVLEQEVWIPHFSSLTRLYASNPRANFCKLGTNSYKLRFIIALI